MSFEGTVVTPDATFEEWLGCHRGPHDPFCRHRAKLRKPEDTHDAGDAYILPGVIDGQTHAGSYLGLPGIEPTTRSAIAGGVTTLVDMPYDNPEPLSSSAQLAAKVEAIHRYAHANVALYGTVMPGQSAGRGFAIGRKAASSASRSPPSRAVRPGFPASTPP